MGFLKVIITKKGRFIYKALFINKDTLIVFLTGYKWKRKKTHTKTHNGRIKSISLVLLIIYTFLKYVCCAITADNGCFWVI